MCVFRAEGAFSFTRAQRRSASLDRFAAVSKEADTRLAGIGLLVRGRHALYVSALAALLASRGARVWEAHEGAPLRVPRGADVAILESPLPSELRALADRGVAVIVLAERAEPADALAAAQLGARALLPKNCTLAELSDCYKERDRRRPGAPAARRSHPGSARCWN